MTSPRSMFTEAIEDHLALKKQNASLNASMPLTRFDAGDPLERFPGGPVRPADADQPLAIDVAAGNAPSAAGSMSADATSDAHLASSAAGATATATAQDAPDMVGSSLADNEYRRPLEPLNGMTPMLSLVRDVDEEDALPTDALAGATAVLPPTPEHSAPVLRFPGGVGPREESEIAEAAQAGGVAVLEADDQLAIDDSAETGEQPIIVIDADEPLAPLSPDGPPMPQSMRPIGGERTKRPRFFGISRGKRRDKNTEADGAGWFAEKPRDFSWDD